jgi:signal transduction histidine kinase
MHEEDDRIARAAVQAVREQASDVAARWSQNVDGGVRDSAMLSDATFRNEAEALIAALLDAAEAATHPPPAVLARHLNRIVEIRAFGTSDPYELIETLDNLCELLHEKLAERIDQLGDATTTGALAATRRLSRALRGMVAAASLVRPAAASAEAPPAALNGAGSDEFVRRLAHDLKNPLGTAKGAAETLIDESALESADQRRQFAEIVIRNLDRAVQLIDDARRPGSGGAGD